LADVMATDVPLGDETVSTTTATKGTVALRQFVFPMLAGLSAADTLSLQPRRPPPEHEFDALLSLVDPTSELGSMTSNVYVRCTQPGDLTINIAVVHAGGWNGARAPLEATASIQAGGQWRDLVTVVIDGYVTIEGAIPAEAVPCYRDQFDRGVLQLGSRNAGDLFRLRFKAETAPPGRDIPAQPPNQLRVHVDAGSANVVHEIETGPDTRVGVNAFHLESESPIRLYVQPIAEEVRIRHFNRKAFTVREAISWTRRGTVQLGQTSPITLTVATPGNQKPLLAVITPGDQIGLEGVAPFVATSLQRWFLPTGT
jgi:hypothetical protein